jgi:transcriptional regulator with XRE-family HTH domain
MKNRIKQVRRILGLTQKEFGLNLGCSRDKIANIELGRVIPDDLFIKHICVVYKISESWMMTGDGEMWDRTGTGGNHMAEAYENLSPTLRCLIDVILRMPERDKVALEAFLLDLSASIHDPLK